MNRAWKFSQTNEIQADAQLWERARKLSRKLVVHPNGAFVRAIACELKAVYNLALEKGKYNE